jgi:ParB family chromosome partitioning protein
VLGRGLDSLLGGAPLAAGAAARRVEAADSPTVDDEARLVELDPAHVAPNPEQPRTSVDAGDLEVLTDSVRTHGVIQPIVVERTASGGHRLIAGERRLLAARAAGLSSIPAIVRPAAESARQALELALTENLVRADLSPMEEAAAYSRLADTFGLSHEAIALRVGRSRAAVTNTVRLLSLPATVQIALGEGRITAGHARALLALPDHDLIDRLTVRAATEQLSVRTVEHLVQQHLEGRVRPPAAREAAARTDPSPDESALLRGFERAVGAPVKLERRRRGGRLVIEFQSDDELDGLYQRLGGDPL